MSDEPNDGNGAVPRIVVPALSSKAMRRPITRAEAIEFITTGVMSMGQKLYREIAEEHARVFAEQERAFDAKIAALRAELMPKSVHDLAPNIPQSAMTPPPDIAP